MVSLGGGIILLSRAPSAEYLRNNLKRQWDKFLYFAKIQKENLALEIDAPRKKPFNLYARQERLMMKIGEPFASFSPEEWQEFWSLVYDVVTERGPQGETIRRQRTEEEIQRSLKYNYPHKFSMFREEHWKLMSSIIYSKHAWK